MSRSGNALSVSVTRNARRRLRLGLSSSLLLAAFGSNVSAQTPVVRPERVPDPGRITATADDSTALVSNPANLAYMPGHELRWSSVYLDDADEVPWQGNAFSFATQLPLVDAALGVRLDFMSPPPGVGPTAAFEYQWLTVGLAFPIGPSSALGASLSGSFSRGAFAGGLTALTLGYSVRPVDPLALSFIVHNANNPSNDFFDFGRSWNVAAAIRPLSTRSFEIGLESAYLENEDVWQPEAQLGLDLGPVGRLRGDFSVSDPTRKSERAWLASLGLSLYLNGAGGSGELTGGVLTGNGFGQNGFNNQYLSVASRGFREPVGIEPGRYAVKLRFEETPSNREHVALLRQLWAIAKEPNIDAVAFELRESPAASLAHLEELRDAVFNLRRAGKRTLCHLEDATGAAIYFCAATNRTLINPAGGVRFAGMHNEQLYLARLLDKVGVRADFVRVGAHKSAPEQFTNSRASDVAREDKVDLLQQFERHFTEGVSVGRGLSFEQVRSRVGEGPFTSEEARAAGFLDGVAFDDEVDKQVNDLTGRRQPVLTSGRAPRARKSFGKEGYVAVVYVDGDLVDGRSSTIPLLGMELVGSYTIADTLKALREDPRVKAVVLRVESPGGSSMASEVIWRQVKLTAAAKPTVVSMGGVAASGGYYIAAPARRIFVSPSTVTGSIGVFYGKADVSGLLSRIGVDVETYRTHAFADTDSLYRGFTPEEQVRLQGKVEQFYQVFLKRVAEGRNMKTEDVDKLGQGRVWSGEQAVANGLADEIGGLRQALAYAREQAGLSDDSPIIELPRIEQSLLSQLIGFPLVQSLYDAPMPKGMTQTLKALGPFLVFDGSKPLSRLEVAIPEFE
jgi:protease IV